MTAAGWLSGEDCPDCGGPLLETSTGPRFLVLECPGCGYRTVWHLTGDRASGDPQDTDNPGESWGEMEAE